MRIKFHRVLLGFFENWDKSSQKKWDKDVPTRGLTLWDVRRKIMHINRTKEIVMNTKRFMLHSVVLAIFTVFSAQSLFSKTVPFSHQPFFGGKSISDR